MKTSTVHAADLRPGMIAKSSSRLYEIIAISPVDVTDRVRSPRDPSIAFTHIADVRTKAGKRLSIAFYDDGFGYEVRAEFGR